MSKDDKAEKATKQDYMMFLLNPDCFDMKDKEIAKLLNVSAPTLSRWKKQVDWSWVLQTRRDNAARDTAEIDQALAKRAKTGDVPAINLWYQRFDGWTPTTKNIQELMGKSDAELEELTALYRKEMDERSGSKAPSDSPREGQA